MCSLPISDGCSHLTVSDYFSGGAEIKVVAFFSLFHAVFWYGALRVVDVTKDGGSSDEAFKAMVVSRLPR